jgi:hypothetical protein
MGQTLGAGQTVALTSELRRPVAARGEQPMQHRQVNGPLDLKPVVSDLQGLVDRWANTQLLPQPARPGPAPPGSPPPARSSH